jgi:hypothetical protein
MEYRGAKDYFPVPEGRFNNFNNTTNVSRIEKSGILPIVRKTDIVKPTCVF